MLAFFDRQHRLPIRVAPLACSLVMDRQGRDHRIHGNMGGCGSSRALRRRVKPRRDELPEQSNRRVSFAGLRGFARGSRMGWAVHQIGMAETSEA